MGKVVASLALSLDGFIADGEGGADWLNEYMKLSRGEDYGMMDFFKTIGTTIMGSGTYEKIISYKGGKGGLGGDCIVFTSRKSPEAKGVSFVNGDPTPIVHELRTNKKDTWLMGGGMLIADFINRNLVDELHFAIMPKLLGKGIPMWPGLHEIHKLKLAESKTFSNGVVQVKYSFM